MDDSARKLLNLLVACGMAQFFLPMLDYGFDRFHDFKLAIQDPRACIELLDKIGMSVQQWSVLVKAYLKLQN